jgi:hypothetical protein
LKHGVDIPYYEEWEFFDVSALPNGLSWQWLSTQVSHQRMVLFTKLMAWINYKLFALDFFKLKIMNYAFFGCFLYLIVRFKNKVLPGSNNFHLFPLFMLFLLSPIIYEVHINTFQSGETAAMFLSVLMLNLIFNAEISYKTTLLFSVCALFGMCSSSAGLIFAIIFLICWTIFYGVNINNNRISCPYGWKNILLVWLILVPGIFIWFDDFKKPDPALWEVAELLLPVKMKFWEVYFELLSYCFGFEWKSLLPGVLCLFFVLAPVMMLLVNKSQRWEISTWLIASAIIGTLAVVALVVIGRGNMPYSIKVSRYVIFGYILIPYTSIAWWLAIKTIVKRRVVLTLFWGFCAVGYSNDWNYSVYPYVEQLELTNLECVGNYNSGGDGVCPGTFVFPIGKYFDSAKRLDIHFTRQFEAKRIVKN